MKFKDEYCEALIEHLVSGGTLESFAKEIKVHISTVFDWFKLKPQFQNARVQAKFLKTKALTEQVRADLKHIDKYRLTVGFKG